MRISDILERTVQTMTDRELLIELIKNAKEQEKYDLLFADMDTAIDMVHGEEYLADYLLANGVIVPTVNCGDRVWFTPKGLGEVCEATVVRIEYNYFTSPQEWIVLDYISSIVGKHEYKSRVDLMLGKTVFLTKEEAEQALKEREKV